MMNRFLLLLLGSSFVLFSCAQQKNVAGSKETDNAPIAFPGAEGYGKHATGGRGGKVYVVTNLNDDGVGSLRWALNKKGPRIIVFAVSGTIHLNSELRIKENTTIAGQSAPGDGICIADYPVNVGGNNVIIRYMRFRMGDRYQNKGKVHGAGHDDALSAIKRKQVIIDHCSISWSTDEVFSAYAGDSITVQWNILSEPLNYSYHFENGDEDFEQHGYGGIWGGLNASFHHNLIAHCVSRTPRFNGTRHTPTENADFRNNVLYNWGSNNVYGGEGGTYSLVNNYYKYGPSTKESVKFRVANPFKKDSTIPFGKYFIQGNFVDGSTNVTANNWLGVIMDKGTAKDAEEAKLKSPIPVAPVTTHSAEQAYRLVLKFAGASLKRDTLDERIVSDVRERKGRIIDVQGGFPHGTDYQVSSVAWPSLISTPAAKDSDEDGMPDEWEQKNGLKPSDASDASTVKLHHYFTNIEVYLNSLIPSDM